MKNKFSAIDAIKGFLIGMFSYLFMTLVILVVQTSIAIKNGQEDFTMTKPVYFISGILLEASFLICLLFVGKKKNVFESLCLNKKINIKALALCIIISLTTLLSFISFNNLFLMFLEKLGCDTQSSTGSYIENIWDLLISLFVLAVMPAICEEVLFRGVCANGLKEKGKWFSIIVSAVLFMIVHLGLSQSIYQVILGIIFAYVLYITKSLWYTIIMHFFNNAFVLIVTYFTKSNSQTPTFDTTWEYILPFIILFIGGVAVFFLLKLLKIQVNKLEPQHEEKNIENQTQTTQVNSVYDQNMQKLENIYFKKIFVLCLVISVTIYLIAVIGSFF